MNKFRLTSNVLAIAIFIFCFASLTQAQSRTWVSGVGDDLNPCSRTAPCKTFAGAISKTAKDGEIDALDPGGFGAVTITKSITIDGAPTGAAGILNSATNGITINITDAADVRKSVTLRGLSIQGAASGTRGVRILAATKVFVENCLITGQNGAPGAGIDDVRTTLSFLEVYNCTITNNNGSGISVNPASGNLQINVHISSSRISGNGAAGVFLGSNVKATIFNSVLTQNATAGVFAQQTAGGNTQANVDHCDVSNNVNGFQANTLNSLIRVSNTTAVGNTTLGVVNAGGLVSSYGNNQTGAVAFPSAPTGPSE